MITAEAKMLGILPDDAKSFSDPEEFLSSLDED